MAEPAVKKSLWATVGKALHILVVGAFFLPFFGVSCTEGAQSIDIITISGADMAIGCEPGGMITQTKNSPDMGGGMGGTDALSGDLKLDKVKIEPLAIIALLLAVVGVLVVFLAKGRHAIIGSLICSVLCLGAVIGIYVKVGGELDHEITNQMKADMEKSSNSSMMRGAKIESGPRMGLWISLACLAACAALSALALGNRSTMPDVVPPGSRPDTEV